MISFVIPSAYTPLSETTLHNGSILPRKRIHYKTYSGSTLTNAIEVRAYDRDTLVNIIKFHAFITRSERGILQYDRQGIEMFRYMETPHEALEAKDFNNMPEILYFDRIKSELTDRPVSFSDMYDVYSGQSVEVLDMVDTFNTHLDGYGGLGKRTIYDPAYWSLVKDFSIIDKIIGQPETCSKGVFSCQCGRENITHHAISMNKHLSDRLDEIMGLGHEQKATYYDIIQIVRNSIRHKTVHAAFTPRAPQLQYPEEAKHYGTTEDVSKYLEDKTALQALEIIFHQIAWNLLMNKIFGFKRFDEPRGLVVQTLNLKRQ